MPSTGSLVDYLSKSRLPTPHLHVVLGSGFGASLEELQATLDWNLSGCLRFDEIEGLARSSVEGHSGEFRIFVKNGRAITLQVGRIHGYEGHTPPQVVRPVLEGVRAGTKTFILTNAAGALTLDFPVGSAVVLRDHINFTGQNPLTGPDKAGPRFPDMTRAYDPELKGAIRTHLKGIPVFEGVYVGVSGPSFETPAEVRTYGLLGGHVVGMSTVWETIALRHAGAKVGGISLVSNSGAGLTHGELSHKEVLEAGKLSARKILEGIFHLASEI